jgi:hypothetical protein
MSGTFERTMYDSGAYDANTIQSTRPALHILNPISTNQCNPCRVPDVGYLGKVGVSVSTDRSLIDIDSNLRFGGYVATRDPNKKYKPTCPQCGTCNEGYPCGGGVVEGCKNCQEKLDHLPSCDNNTEYTRISNPICNSRGVGVNRFQPLCLNPQDETRWLQPSNVGINYRMVVKDNHVPCIPKPFDQTLALPKGGQLPCPPTQSSVCGNYLKPLHNQYVNLNTNWNNLK